MSEPGADGFLQIGQVAERTELSIKTIRHYEEVGLVTPSARSAGGFRLYTGADVDRLLMFAAGKPKITLKDVEETVSAETAQDDWAVANAIERRNASEALRQLALQLESGTVSYLVLGQLAGFVRRRATDSRGYGAPDPKWIRNAVDALFRTDVELKSSGGDPRILLERLVVELCRR